MDFKRYYQNVRNFYFFILTSLLFLALGTSLVIWIFSDISTDTVHERPVLVSEEHNIGELKTTPNNTDKAEHLEFTKPAPLFVDDFSSALTLEETSTIRESGSTSWWLSSGGLFFVENGVGKTIQGKLPSLAKWRLKYATSNQRDTDNGYQPQNIFRLVTREKALNYSEEIYFSIHADNVSKSPNKNDSNGVLLFNRYQDRDNLYYVGLRVDGYAVIKRKEGGVYTTLAYIPVFPGKYDQNEKSNLIPKDTWIGIRSTVTNIESGIAISLSIDVGRSGTWTPVVNIIDTEVSSGSILRKDGHVGIRTDFMDVLFDDFKIKALDPS